MITLPCPPHKGRKKGITQADLVQLIRPLVKRCCQVTGYTYAELRVKTSRNHKLIRARMALAHVIFAAGATQQIAADCVGMTYETCHWTQWRSRELYDTDPNFQALCNAIAGIEK